jgi:hypothetical protein
MSLTKERLEEIVAADHYDEEKQQMAQELLSRREAERWRDASVEPPTEPGAYTVLRERNTWPTSRIWNGTTWETRDNVLWWRPLPDGPAAPEGK